VKRTIIIMLVASFSLFVWSCGAMSSSKTPEPEVVVPEVVVPAFDAMEGITFSKVWVYAKKSPEELVKSVKNPDEMLPVLYGVKTIEANTPFTITGPAQRFYFGKNELVFVPVSLDKEPDLYMFQPWVMEVNSALGVITEETILYDRPELIAVSDKGVKVPRMTIVSYSLDDKDEGFYRIAYLTSSSNPVKDVYVKTDAVSIGMADIYTTLLYKTAMASTVRDTKFELLKNALGYNAPNFSLDVQTELDKMINEDDAAARPVAE